MIIELFKQTPVFGVLLSLGTFYIGQVLFKNQRASSYLHHYLLRWF